MNPTDVAAQLTHDQALRFCRWASDRSLTELEQLPAWGPDARQLHTDAWNRRPLPFFLARITRRHRWTQLRAFITDGHRVHEPDTPYGQWFNTFTIGLAPTCGRNSARCLAKLIVFQAAYNHTLTTDELWEALGRSQQIPDSQLSIYSDLAPDWTGQPALLASTCTELLAT